MANLIFAQEQQSETQSNKEIKKILIVDDDKAIHDVTNIALESMKFSHFELQVFNAYSFSEAIKILEEHDDIALALIDVVMEEPEAGLNLVNYIREEMENEFIRLIIRTGQANDFPPMHVIQHYDINDFKEKTELTRERLYTTIRTSIKQYDQLIELQHKYEETYRQMTTDTLTQLPNRMKLIEDYSKHSHQTLILIDIIDFRRKSSRLCHSASQKCPDGGHEQSCRHTVSNHITNSDTDPPFTYFRELEKIEIITTGFITIYTFTDDIQFF